MKAQCKAVYLSCINQMSGWTLEGEEDTLTTLSLSLLYIALLEGWPGPILVPLCWEALHARWMPA